MTGPRGLYVVCAELVVVGKEPHALHPDLFKPDPLSGFARVIELRQPDLLEDVEARLGFLPLGPVARARWRREVAGKTKSILGGDSHTPPAGGRFWEDFKQQARGGNVSARAAGSSRNGNGRRPAPDSPEALALRVERAERAKRYAKHDALFRLQVLLRAQSTLEGRAIHLLEALEGCFAVFADGSRYRAAGRRIGFGDQTLWFWGVDATRLSRWWFDLRWDTGLFRPSGGGSVVSNREVAGLMTPPTKWCTADNIVRSGGSVPAAPHELIGWRGQADVIPWGYVVGPKGRRLVGVRTADTTGGFFAGRAGAGKSEVGSLGFVWLAEHTRNSGFFLDPAGQVMERLPDYLTDQADRLVLLDVSSHRPERAVAAWNPLDMTGRDTSDVERVVKPLVDAIRLVNGWKSGTNSRAINLTQNALLTLAQLGLALPADCQPTIFQVLPLLTNDDWRAAVLQAVGRDGQPVVHKPQADFWAQFGGQQAGYRGEATAAVTHTIYRLRDSRTIAAMLGQSRTAFDMRRAMDNGQLVIACTAAASEDESRLIAAMLTFGFLRAALSRVDTPERQRRPVMAWFDEAHVADDGTLANVLREGRKFLRGREGGGLFILDQDPLALTQDTRNAIATNASHILTGTVGNDEAVWLTKQWSDQVEPSTLKRLAAGARRPDDSLLYEYVTTVTIHGRPTQPFKLEGAAVAEVFARHYHPDRRPQLEATVDRVAGRRMPADVIADLNTLDDRIRKALGGGMVRSGRHGTIASTSSPDDHTY